MTHTPQAGDAGPELLLQWLECRSSDDRLASALTFSAAELDLLQECVRLQAQDLLRRSHNASSVERGSWADRVFALDRRFSAELHRRRPA